MKTIIAIFILVSSAFGIVIQGDKTKQGNDDLHRTCSCSGTFCSCSVSCLDLTEIPSCVCGTFSCICKCDPKDAVNPNEIPVPSMSSDQEANSIKGEGYFRGLGSASGITIANGIKALREAIKAGDGNKYLANANTTESAFNSLPDAQKTAWEAWSNANLKK